MIVTLFKYLRHGRKKVYVHFASTILFIYILLTSLKFRLDILLNVENIAKTILVALEVSISIFRKDHSVRKKNYGLS